MIKEKMQKWLGIDLLWWRYTQIKSKSDGLPKEIGAFHEWIKENYQRTKRSEELLWALIKHLDLYYDDDEKKYKYIHRIQKIDAIDKKLEELDVGIKVMQNRFEEWCKKLNQADDWSENEIKFLADLLQDYNKKLDENISNKNRIRSKTSHTKSKSTRNKR